MNAVRRSTAAMSHRYGVNTHLTGCPATQVTFTSINSLAAAPAVLRPVTAATTRQFATIPEDLRKTIKKDPRTIPRALVWVGTVGLLGALFFRNGEKVASQTQDRRNVIDENPPPDNSFIKKTADATKGLSLSSEDTGNIQKAAGKGLGVPEDNQSTSNNN